jgi:hypothetical protein
MFYLLSLKLWGLLFFFFQYALVLTKFNLESFIYLMFLEITLNLRPLMNSLTHQIRHFASTLILSMKFFIHEAYYYERRVRQHHANEGLSRTTKA